jgi:hypothetical protein
MPVTRVRAVKCAADKGADNHGFLDDDLGGWPSPR